MQTSKPASVEIYGILVIYILRKCNATNQEKWINCVVNSNKDFKPGLENKSTEKSRTRMNRRK